MCALAGSCRRSSRQVLLDPDREMGAHFRGLTRVKNVKTQMKME